MTPIETESNSELKLQDSPFYQKMKKVSFLCTWVGILSLQMSGLVDLLFSLTENKNTLINQTQTKPKETSQFDIQQLFEVLFWCFLNTLGLEGNW